jgi:hypothetical protein
MKEKRKAFKNLSEEDMKEANETGRIILETLVQKFGVDTPEGCDGILNSLCVTLSLFAITSVQRDNRNYFCQLVFKILSNNLEQKKDID